MRTWTLVEVRELLSSAPATAFLERWADAAGARDLLAERMDDLRAQAVTAQGRARLADERARTHEERADLQRRRLALATEGVVVRLEAEALAASARAEADQSQREAVERRRRAEALEAEAQLVKVELATRDRALDRLWGEAGALGGHVGESCLFFASADVPGGWYVVPLVALNLDARRLDAFVLHRLEPGEALAKAHPIRDTAPADGETEPGADPLEPPVEVPAGG